MSWRCERLRDIASEATVAFPDEPLRVVVYRMVESGFTRLPVVDREDEKRLQGMVSLEDLLRARGRNLEEERTRERILRLRMPLGRRAEAENVGS
jgi:CIC family chloride channel protein